MPGRRARVHFLSSLLVAIVALPALAPLAFGGQKAPQRIDAEYTDLIKRHTQDPRVTTELVDYLPASDTVPSPLEFLGRIAGTPDELTYYKDIKRYFEALDKASNRVALFPIGKSEEGREMFVAAIADETTLKALDRYKKILADLTDPRRLDAARARSLVAAGKPVYWATGNLHSGETGSAEMQMELAFRLAVDESPHIKQIRDNVIVLLTPVLEVDGREKVVDNFYYQKKTKQSIPLVYWGQYVAHDNNRDGLGVGLKLTENVLRTYLDWHPTVLHDLHESIPYLYTSTGAGPYNTELDPLQTDEWWLLAKYEVAEMTKRGVPGVWTGGFYDGWTPNYLFFIANNHNGIGRFYETQTYGPRNQEITLPASATSREWYRPNPPLPSIKWGPRNNVNVQQSALLLALSFVARNRAMLLENYYLKNKRSVEKGRQVAPHAWVIPAGQRRKGAAAALVNLLRQQGVEVHAAAAPFAAGRIDVAAGDFIVRTDQPYGNLVRIFLGTQFFAPGNPSPYDDTGWSLPLLRNVTAHPVTDRGILDRAMTLLATDARVAGTVTGSGRVLVVEHDASDALATFRFAHRSLRMLAAEEPFEAGGRRFSAGAFIIPDGDRASLEASIAELGLSAVAVPAEPSVRTHEMRTPRIGYVHSWSRTQDEGWVRMAFDKLKIPYDYFGDTRLREGNLRQKYDVIVFPHVGGTPQSQVNGIPLRGEPIPYRKSELTPNLGVQDSADDIRGGMGLAGLANLQKFVEEGGLLITEGSTSTIFPAYGLLSGVAVEEPAGLFARGVVVKSVFADRRSPIAYGYEEALPVYFSSGPVLRAGGSSAARRNAPAIPGVGQNLTPNAVPPTLASMDAASKQGPADGGAETSGEARSGTEAEAAPRVILRFPDDPSDMLLSGGLVGQEALAGRALVVDARLGKGHVVMFANRPYWRWQTHGSFNLGFNAMLNWEHLDAGR